MAIQYSFGHPRRCRQVFTAGYVAGMGCPSQTVYEQAGGQWFTHTSLCCKSCENIAKSDFPWARSVIVVEQNAELV